MSYLRRAFCGSAAHSDVIRKPSDSLHFTDPIEWAETYEDDHFMDSSTLICELRLRPENWEIARGVTRVSFVIDALADFRAGHQCTLRAKRRVLDLGQATLHPHRDYCEPPRATE